MSKNLAKTNTKKLLELFPEIVTEIKNDKGDIVKAINKDKLEQLINVSIVDNAIEQYGFNWAGKRNAIATANAPTNKKLIFCEEESISPDTTENLYIEGDNLDVLKILQEDYEGKIKMIYIDPPYNTRHKFVYNDKFSHTDWLNMMYPRLKLAKNLLTEDGVIFISIDDNEVRNLKILCDEIFGEQNFVAQCIRRTINSGKYDVTTIAPFHEYLLIYSRSIDKLALLKKPKSEEERDKLYKESDEYEKIRGRYYLTQLNMNSLQYSDGLNYAITGPDGVEIWPGSGFDDKVWIWRWSKTKVEWGIKNGFIVFKKSGDKYKIYTKSYEFVDKDGNLIERNNPYSSLEFVGKEYANFNATPELEKLFEGKKYFDFPKSCVFMKEIVKMVNLDDSSIILDFFSGSATTAHAVMQLNAEDGGKRKFIMVQLQEECPEDSEAFKAGYKNICEIGKERIRRAGKKIVDEAGLFNNLDIGFKVYKTIEKENEQTIK